MRGDGPWEQWATCFFLLFWVKFVRCTAFQPGFRAPLPGRVNRAPGRVEAGETSACGEDLTGRLSFLCPCCHPLAEASENHDQEGGRKATLPTHGGSGRWEIDASRGESHPAHLTPSH